MGVAPSGPPVPNAILALTRRDSRLVGYNSRTRRGASVVTWHRDLACACDIASVKVDASTEQLVPVQLSSDVSGDRGRLIFEYPVCA